MALVREVLSIPLVPNSCMAHPDKSHRMVWFSGAYRVCAERAQYSYFVDCMSQPIGVSMLWSEYRVRTPVAGILPHNDMIALWLVACVAISRI